jgi:NAD(P)-dependent dehydrogenase (short-subunit alcohol dehydrogenase family)
MLAHDVEKTKVQIQVLTKQTGNAKITAIPTNLFSLASVKAAVEEVLKQTDRVDGLVNDAGSDSPGFGLTEDGFDSAMQLTYISAFYLVELLLPKLREVQGRVVATSTASIDIESALCPYIGAEPGCWKIDFIKPYATEPHQDGFGSNFMALYLKTMHARIIAKKEAHYGVTAYSFHPGTVVTTGTENSAAMKAMGGVEAMGPLCAGAVWWGCVCSGPDGKTSKQCPLSTGEGALPGAYLAAAPAAELAPINGMLTVLCGEHPGPDATVGYLDPYPQLVSKLGQAGTDAYLQKIDELSMSWIEASSATTLSQVSISRAASSIAAVAFVAACVLVLVASRRQQPTMGNYKLLVSENDA